MPTLIGSVSLSQILAVAIIGGIVIVTLVGGFMLAILIAGRRK